MGRKGTRAKGGLGKSPEAVSRKRKKAEEVQVAEMEDASEQRDSVNVDSNLDKKLKNIGSVKKKVKTAEDESEEKAKREPLIEIQENQTLLFNEIKELEKVHRNLQTRKSLALEDAGNPAEQKPTKLEALFMKLRDLRTTEAEHLLQESRRMADVYSKAQNQLIVSLRKEIESLKEKSDNRVTEGKEVENLKKQVADLKKQVSEATSSEGGDAVAEKHLALLQKITGVKFETTEDGIMVCTMKNTTKKTKFRYELELVSGGGFFYRPVQGISSIPKELQEELELASGADLPQLQALLQHHVFS